MNHVNETAAADPSPSDLWAHYSEYVLTSWNKASPANSREALEKCQESHATVTFHLSEASTENYTPSAPSPLYWKEIQQQQWKAHRYKSVSRYRQSSWFPTGCLSALNTVQSRRLFKYKLPLGLKHQFDSCSASSILQLSLKTTYVIIINEILMIFRAD